MQLQAINRAKATNCIPQLGGYRVFRAMGENYVQPAHRIMLMEINEVEGGGEWGGYSPVSTHTNSLVGVACRKTTKKLISKVVSLVPRDLFSWHLTEGTFNYVL